MKKLIIITVTILFSSCASSQPISTDSLSIIIRGMQKQIAVLQTQIGNLSQQKTITFDPTSFTVTTKDSLNQSVFLKPVSVDLTSINTAITNLQNKIASLKAISTTTTIIQ